MPPGQSRDWARERELVWTTREPLRTQLARDGYHIVQFRDLLRSVRRSRATGLVRSSLKNPASRLLALFDAHASVALIGAPCRTVDDLQVLYGYFVEPGYRRGCSLLVHAERGLEDFAGDAFVDPDWRYPWTLERLRYLASRARGRRSCADLMPALTTTEPSPAAERPAASPPPPAVVNSWRRLVRRLSRRSDTRFAAPAERHCTAVTFGPPAISPRLDPEQTAAVRAGEGVVQVIAPAGSGKTSVLVERVRELLRRGAASSQILCTTFNKAARSEIELRLERAGISAITVQSFHGLGWSILKQERCLRSTVGRLGHGQWRWLATQAMQAEPDGVWLDPADAQSEISAFKLAKMISPQTALALAQAGPARARTVARVFALYEQLMRQGAMLDFDDLIAKAVTLLQDDAATRRRWQARFAHVLVDEYQDIEPAQALLVGILAAPEDSLFCVGDEDQCIYAWRRASVQRVVELDQCYPGLERFPLVRNYRCGKSITAASRRLIEHNRCRFHKTIRPGATHDGEIRLLPVADRVVGAELVAQMLRTASRGQVVVLARTTCLLREVALACASGGVDFDAPQKVISSPDVYRVLGAYLRLLADPRHAAVEDIERAFRVPSRHLPPRAAAKVASGLRAGQTFFRTLAALPAEAWRRQRLTETGVLLDALAVEPDAWHIVQRLRKEGGLDAHYASRERMNETEKIDLETLDAVHDAATGCSLRQYSVIISAKTDAPRLHAQPDAVELSTIHGAKGRQWSRVILFGADQGQLPHHQSMSDDPHDAGLEDERRLCYVALTRATASLDIVYTATAPSPFLAEAGLRVR